MWTPLDSKSHLERGFSCSHRRIGCICGDHGGTTNSGESGCMVKGLFVDSQEVSGGGLLHASVPYGGGDCRSAIGYRELRAGAEVRG